MLRWYAAVAGATLAGTVVVAACEHRSLVGVPELSGAPLGAQVQLPIPTLAAAAAVATAPAAALADLAPVAASPVPEGACPGGMLLIEGDYCPNVQQRCLDYMDPKGRYEFYRCREYEQPIKCLSKQREHKRFCSDRTEYAPVGRSLPANDQSWTHADKTCGGLGKRVCFESEWNFACEGEEMRPYPYGWKRDPSACNADETDLVDAEGKLKDRRAPPGAHPRCASPFGVLDLSGNLEEFVTIDGSVPPRPAMKGAYWQPSRNFCRAAQTAHDEYYHGTETGFRCCSDVK